MNIFESYIDAGQQLAQRDKEQFYTALIEFIAYGLEPTKLKGASMAVFTAIRPSLEISKQKADSGRKGGEQKAKQTAKQTPSKRQAKAKQTPKQTPSKSEANAEANAKQTPSKSEANAEANSNSNSNSNKEISPNGDIKKARPRFVKPHVDEVANYASELSNNPFDASGFIDYYESNGWKVGRNPMKDWRAAVRNWIRRDAPEPKDGDGYHAEYD